MKKLLPVILLSILLSACHSKESSIENLESGVDYYDENLSVSPPTTSNRSTSLPTQNIQDKVKKKIIKDGRLGLKVNDLALAKKKVDDALKKYDGYYANENFNNSDWESSYSLKIRVPSSNFEKFVQTVERGNDEILFKSMDARDVTDQFIDLETRLENKRNYLDRYKALLKKANSIKEILQVEEKIRVLEEEIESTTGRLKYLSDQVAFSSLDLTISKPKDYKYNPGRRDKFSERLKASLSKGWFTFIDFLLFMINLWPFLFIIVMLVFAWKRYRKKKIKNSSK